MQTNDKAKQPPQSQTLWQHPYVDVFKHFKITPTADWKQNKKQGDVSEIFAKEIGRKAMQIAGSISANNFITLPHPNCLLRSLNLTGRFLYLEVKSPNAGTPFSLHFDYGLAERSHSLRLSVSNLFKNFNTSNGFVLQVPLELNSDRWTVVCLDLYEIFKKSALFPASYKIEGAFSLKSMNLCANIQIRGIYTSDNVYDYITLPSDMRFKFGFDIHRWEEFFDWRTLPQDLEAGGQQKKIIDTLQDSQRSKERKREEERKKMSKEIDDLLHREKQEKKEEEVPKQAARKTRVAAIPEPQIVHSPPETSQVAQGFIMKDRASKRQQVVNLQGLEKRQNDYVSGSYIGVDLKRSAKLNVDPVLELKHIIGYSPDKCLNLKWSKYNNENVVIFTSGGNLIAMDVNQNSQKRFFFGHSAPIVCFDINSNGTLLGSAQEGKNSIIRIWEYTSGRCISMVTMPVNKLQCLAFSYDGKYLASVGKDSHNREMIIVWDISKIQKGEKPEIVAKQTSDFNILQLKFSPIDSSRMASCGKENIRFWRIKDNGSIRGSAVVLNHHARNTVFTSLDFEYGARSVDPKENESLKRLFVGSKHGMVFQINYHTEALEATFQTNDGAIYSIAVNEAFCVTGSEDTYLRVWPLDFSEFFMEAKHEGTVCSVDISWDGLKVVCGTTYGSLGILDKSNQKYRTLLRSHTSSILNMDFHIAKQNMITVSRDKTIRLWDIESFDQAYEFSSPIDQPISVAAHPSLPLFSCGFESGMMRVFDIERTCVADEFSQFNKPLVKLAYSPQGDLLITCCADGGVAIHNARRQHLPIKMMHLEFPPEFAHVAFTVDTPDNFKSFEAQNENQDPNEINFKEVRFAIMGEYGNNVNIYDTNSFIVRHQIQAHSLLRAFQFSNNNREIVMTTTDCKIKVYSLAKFEGILLRELTSVHRGNVVSLSISNNSGFMLSGGEDNMIRVWDYEASKTIPYYFQSFIGHTYPVKCLMFNPNNNGIVMSAGENDGIYIWGFYGDIKTQFYHKQGISEDQPSSQIQPRSSSIGRLQSQSSMLEKMRNQRKESKNQALLPENSFILPNFKQLQILEQDQEDIKGPESEFFEDQQLAKMRRERQLNYNHYLGAGREYEVSQEALYLAEGEERDKLMDTCIVNGYDGAGGAHSNMVWHSHDGWIAYTIHNKVIFEILKSREQTVVNDAQTYLSTLAISPNKNLIAAAEGQANSQKHSFIYLYEVHSKKLLSKLNFHEKGVQAMAFSNCSKYLISVGVQGENTLAIWDISQGLVIKSALIRHYATNCIKVDPHIDEDYIMFCTVGSRASFSFWRLDLETTNLQTFDVDAPADFEFSDFTSLEYTPFLPHPYNTYLILLTASDGSMTAYDQKNNVFIENGTKKQVTNGEIGQICCQNNMIIMGSSKGILTRHHINNAQVFPQEGSGVQLMKFDSGITSISMDPQNNEGIVGTANGSIYYINFDEKHQLKIGNNQQKNITQIKVYPQNPQLFLTNSYGSERSQVRLWRTSYVDLVTKFNGFQRNNAVFILPNVFQGRFSLVGYSSGLIHIFSIENLKIEGYVQVPLEENEVLTAGVFNPNGINVAIGTSFGNAYVGSLKQETTGGPKFSIGKLENVSKIQTAITSLQFSNFDPIGSLLVAFDNGVIKTWQSSVKNEQFMKLLEIQQQQEKQTILFDLSECGYQQFDLVDVFDMFANPHSLENLTEEDKQQLKLLYQSKRYSQCEARFPTGSTSADLYFSYVSALQYIYVRNYSTNSLVKQVSLMFFPTCMSLIDYNAVQLQENFEEPKGGEACLVCIGTKEGKVVAYKISSTQNKKLIESRGGVSFGAITSLDCTPNGDTIVACSESGEILTFDLLEQLEGENDQQ